MTFSLKEPKTLSSFRQIPTFGLRDMAFLWVQWLGVEPDYVSGFRQAKLPMVGFVPVSDPSAFGCLDPALVIHGCHLIPAFRNGRTQDLLPVTCSLGRGVDKVDDWANYYVNIYVCSFPAAVQKG